MVRRRSRDSKKEAFWRRTISRQAGSRMSVRAWCRGHPVRESSFYWWRRQLARRDANAPPRVPVRVDPFAYLRDVLTRLPATPIHELDRFLPDRWSTTN